MKIKASEGPLNLASVLLKLPWKEVTGAGDSGGKETSSPFLQLRLAEQKASELSKLWGQDMDICGGGVQLGLGTE